MIDDALIQRITRQVMQRMQDETAPLDPDPIPMVINHR